MIRFIVADWAMPNLLWISFEQLPFLDITNIYLSVTCKMFLLSIIIIFDFVPFKSKFRTHMNALDKLDYPILICRYKCGIICKTQVWSHETSNTNSTIPSVNCYNCGRMPILDLHHSILDLFFHPHLGRKFAPLCFDFCINLTKKLYSNKITCI